MNTQSAESAFLEQQPQRVLAFQKGYGMVEASVPLPGKKGVYNTAPLPPARMGSLWLSWPQSVRIADVKAVQATQTVEQEAHSLAALLEANIGMQVQLVDEDGSISPPYEVVRMLDSSAVEPMPRDGQGRIHSDLVALRSPEGEVVVRSLTGLRSVQFVDGSQVAFTFQQPRQREMVSFRVDKAAKNANLMMRYLAKGISWSPSYVIELVDEQEAAISAKAILVNDLLDLENTPVEIISGFPHLAYAAQDSPFRLGEVSIERFADEQEVMYSAPRAALSMADMAPPPLEAEQTEDLFFFKLDEVNLKKGERGYYPMFSQTVPYEHLYTWEIPDFVGTNTRYRQDRINQQYDVWHTVHLTNEGDVPWTDGPAMTMKDGRPLGQDKIDYTPSGAEVSLKITKAQMIKAEQSEEEIDRRINVMSIQRRQFDQVTLKGELVVTNYSQETVPLEITKTLSGDVVKADGKPEITKIASGLRRENPETILVWNQQLKPGEKNQLKLTYTYKVLLED